MTDPDRNPYKMMFPDYLSHSLLLPLGLAWARAQDTGPAQVAVIIPEWISQYGNIILIQIIVWCTESMLSRVEL
jgi:hypothetical protein